MSHCYLVVIMRFRLRVARLGLLFGQFCGARDIRNKLLDHLAIEILQVRSDGIEHLGTGPATALMLEHEGF